MEPVTAEEILSAFDEADEDIPLPDLERVDFDALDYLGWIHPSGHLGYLVLLSPNDARLKGVVMRRSSFGGTRPGFEMCSLCHHMHQPHGTAMFTMTCKDTNHRHSIGNVVCKNLDCSLRIRDMVDPAPFIKETLYVEAKIWRMQLALHKWMRAANRL